MQVLNQHHSDRFAAYHADCVEVVSALPTASIDLSVYSPPFSSLYIYSDSERDMGNCSSDVEFIEQYSFVLRELHRVTRPGRLSAVHVKDLVYYRNQGGTAGLRDFTGMVIKAHQDAGFDFHCRITIRRSPVREMQKTKAHGLLYKTVRTDASHTRVGMPEYLLVFRRWPENEAEEDLQRPILHDRADFPLEIWQQWAEPVWMDTDETNVLNVTVAREDRDEKHICPMPLDLSERAVVLWSNKGDTVLSPYMGIGSEGVTSLRNGRRFIGAELKEAYFRQAVRHLADAENTSAFGNMLDRARA